MKNLIRAEEITLFMLALYFNSLLPFPSWYFWAFLLLPDISMLGYLVNTQVGAYAYNIFHHRGIALVVLLTGFIFQHNELTLSGVVLFGHSSLDRIFGYGLKYLDNFKHTHLGWIGKSDS
ncbi:MAG: DUF4260 domain-containing protein [Flammeovirgaceae bacterium]|nr:DUF4260 domain-containing protein [Flammeovirgaceae bacterium]